MATVRIKNIANDPKADQHGTLGAVWRDGSRLMATVYLKGGPKEYDAYHLKPVDEDAERLVGIQAIVNAYNQKNSRYNLGRAKTR